MLKPATPVKIAIVDDDESIRESVLGLVESAGYDGVVFKSAEAFLNQANPDEFACLILDIRLTGITGLELHQHLIKSRQRIPTVFITAHADEAVASRALAQGAEAFLHKPFKVEALLDAVNTAVIKSEE